MVDKLSNMTAVDPQALASDITSTLVEACSLAELRVKKVNFSNSDKPWFDKDCQTLKNSIKKNCKKLRKNKSDISLQQQISAENKELKKLVSKKKNEYKLEIVNEMNMTGKNQKYFWKLLDKLDGSPREDIFKDCIAGTRWVEHFKTVLREEERIISYPADSTDLGPLDYRITRKELSEAEYVLRPYKSTGYDSLSNEIIKCQNPLKPTAHTNLFSLDSEVWKGTRIHKWLDLLR